MSAPRKAPITKDDLVRSNGAMLVLTSLLVLSRVAIQISRCRAFELTDFFIYFAFILFVAMWTCYLLTIPSMFRVYAVIDGLESRIL
ncbi:hypothetical protein PTTW11_06875 [Pyrenophora teres f. teres]|uniref:Uncharacterized protein n=1 Tax=Pyrenophora teres f. teres TaxID=97479 RepID=A0A6S6W5C6_9PLEO|nr:hypothetical protein PTTW11_06875 [Pyrenophora teres f. teres]